MGDLNHIQERLQSSLDPNSCNNHGESLLHTAVLHQRLAIVQCLLAAGADVNQEIPVRSLHHHNLSLSESVNSSITPRSENFRHSRMLSAEEATPLHYAAAVGNLEIMKLLLSWKIKRKGEPFSLKRNGSLLLWAITCGHPHIVEYLLLKKKLEQNCIDEDGNNAVAIAALVWSHPNHQHLLRQLLRVFVQADGIDLNHRNLYGLAPFDVAEQEHVKELLQKFGGSSARVQNIDSLFTWNRERSRQEYTFRRDRQRAIQLRNRE